MDLFDALKSAKIKGRVRVPGRMYIRVFDAVRDTVQFHKPVHELVIAPAIEAPVIFQPKPPPPLPPWYPPPPKKKPPRLPPPPIGGGGKQIK